MMEKNVPPTAPRRGSTGQGLLRNVEMVDLIRHQMDVERVMFRHPGQQVFSELGFPAIPGQQPFGLFHEVTLPIYEETVRTTAAAAEAVAAAAGAGAGVQSSSEGSDLVVMDDSDSDDFEIVMNNQLSQLTSNPSRSQAQAGGRTEAKAPGKESDKKANDEADKKKAEEEEEEVLPPTFRWVHIDIV